MQTRHFKAISKNFIGETEIAEALRLIEEDETYNTGSSYSADTTAYPDHQIPFAKKHVAYLKSHPLLDPEHYLSNLRLMLRVRK